MRGICPPRGCTLCCSFLVSLLLLFIIITTICSAECFYIEGDMSAEFSVEQKISYEIMGALNNFTYRYYPPADYNYHFNTQEIKNKTITFSSHPTTQQHGKDEFGNSYTDFIWNDISDATLDITVSATAITKVVLNSFTSSDLFPLDQRTIPEDAQQYLGSTALVQSKNPEIKALAEQLVQGCTHQFEAVENIIKWIINTIEYGSNSEKDALSTFDQGKGVCMNFSHLGCALLRAVGIPARYVSGISLRKPYSWSYGYSIYTTTWFSGSHAWIEVFYPELGWVPYDPQRDIHHIDVFRIKKMHGNHNDSVQSVSYSYSYPSPTIYRTEFPYIVDIKNDIININCHNKTDEITVNTYALSLEVIPSNSHTMSSPNLNHNGDLNGDGYITPMDALIAFKCHCGLSPCSDDADVNQDNMVTPEDALCILRKYLTLPNCLD